MIRFLYLGFFLLSTVVYSQQPNWVVNESNYQYSMTLICKLNVNGRMLSGSNDLVGAFVSNELRGVSSPSYVASLDDYYTYMTIFSNQQGETVSFRIYDSSTNTYHNVSMTLDFVVNQHRGTLFQSVSIASPALNSAADIEAFGFVDVPLNDSVREGSSYTLYIPSIISKETLVPSFTLSEGARSYINQSPQVSGVSEVDFTNPVVYQVLSEDESTLNTFTLEVIYSFDDYDGDGLEDEADLDDDNDCFSDQIEEQLGTNPLDATSRPEDVDEDCIADALDPDTENDGFADDQIFVDEFFSPNGDGINDHWNIVNIERFSNNQLWIYTRSGKLILSQSPYRNDWMGTYQGESLPEGNYYYQLDIEGDKTIDAQGWIYLSR
jgi:gliding motility-associated-like protein